MKITFWAITAMIAISHFIPQLKTKWNINFTQFVLNQILDRPFNDISQETFNQIGNEPGQGSQNPVQRSKSMNMDINVANFSNVKSTHGNLAIFAYFLKCGIKIDVNFADGSVGWCRNANALELCWGRISGLSVSEANICR